MLLSLSVGFCLSEFRIWYLFFLVIGIGFLDECRFCVKFCFCVLSFVINLGVGCGYVIKLEVY